MKVAINGLGRIGRLVLKIALEKNINVVAANDLTDLKTLAYLLQNDSVYGKYPKKVTAGKGFIKIGNKKVKVFSEPNPEDLPWNDLGVNVVVEATGRFTDAKQAFKHLTAGAKKVVISAPATNHDVTIVPGVNDKMLKKSHRIISMASCTTNALAPVAKLLDDAYGIKKGFLTTVHAYTSSQGLVDMPNKKLNRGRAAALNIIPTTTGATKATCQVLPKLEGKLDGMALRVPVASGSIIDFVVELKKKTTSEKINKVFKNAAKGRLKGVLQYTDQELVSTDIIKNPSSSIVSGSHTRANGNLVKVLSWYDNEYGYSSRMIDMLKLLK